MPFVPTLSLNYVFSKGTNQKSPQRLRRRRRFSCPHLQALKHGLWSKTTKNRSPLRRRPEQLSQTLTVFSFKNYRKNQKIVIVGVPSSCEDLGFIFRTRRSVLHFREIALPRRGRSGNTLFSDGRGIVAFLARPFAAFEVAS